MNLGLDEEHLLRLGPVRSGARGTPPDHKVIDDLVDEWRQAVLPFGEPAPVGKLAIIFEATRIAACYRNWVALVLCTLCFIVGFGLLVWIVIENCLYVWKAM